MKKTVFMYSGQGSHFYQMGKKLYENNPVFKEWMDKLDETARELLGTSIIAQIYNPVKKIGDSFAKTLYTHPAIFMTEYALTQVLFDKGVKPDLVFGTSLGEFAAAAVSGILDYKDAMEMVIKQAMLLETKCDIGGMLAIVDKPALYNEMQLLSEHTVVAGINFDSHFVVTGKKNILHMIAEELKENKKTCFILPVSHGFHSTLIEPAREEYLEFLQAKTYKKAAIPFISSCTVATEYELPNSHFWNAIREPIRFREAISLIDSDNYIYVDIGPSGTLATFLGYLDPAKKQHSFPIMNQFGQEEKNIEKLLSLT